MPRFQFSLLTALFLMTIISMAIVMIGLWLKISPLEAEVGRLRNEVGVLSISDPNKLHAIQVRTNDELVWKWRVWIPKGMVYVVHCTGEHIPKEGFPQQDRSSSWMRDAGEQVIEYRVRRDPRDDKWYGSLHTSSGSAGKDAQPWVPWKTSTATGDGVGYATSVCERGELLVLSRHRVSQVANINQIEDPSEGFLVWMEASK